MYRGVVVITLGGWGTGVQFKSLRPAMQCGEALPLPSKTSPLQKIKVSNVDVLKYEISKTKILYCVCV